MFWLSAGLLCNHPLMWCKWDRGVKKGSGDTELVSFSGIIECGIMVKTDAVP